MATEYRVSICACHWQNLVKTVYKEKRTYHISHVEHTKFELHSIMLTQLEVVRLRYY